MARLFYARHRLEVRMRFCIVCKQESKKFGGEFTITAVKDRTSKEVSLTIDEFIGFRFRFIKLKTVQTNENVDQFTESRARSYSRCVHDRRAIPSDKESGAGSPP